MLTMWGEGVLVSVRDRQARCTDVNVVVGWGGGVAACVSEG